MNLLMLAPLTDSRGNLRYFIGAQVDVSGLVKDCTDLDAFKHYLDVKEGRVEPDPVKDEFQELSEMFNNSEIETVKRHGGNMHREHVEDDDGISMRGGQTGRGGPRLLINDISSFENAAAVPVGKAEGRLQGVYKHVNECSCDIRLSLTLESVPVDSARAFATHTLRLAQSTCPRYPPVKIPRSHWRQRADTQFCRRSTQRPHARRHREDQMAHHARFQP